MALFILSVPIFSSPDFDKGVDLFLIPPFLINFSSYVLMTGFFFLHHYLLFPKLYHKKKWWSYILAVLVCCYLTFSLPQLVPLMGGATADPSFPQPAMEPYQRGYFFRMIFFNNGIVFQFIAIWLVSLFISLRDCLRVAENEKLTAEVNFLKAKIHPHFLFNTLNNIYSLALTNSQETPNSILRLSHLMRYIVTESANKKVLLSKEIEHIQNFVSLQKLRMNDNNTLDLKINGRPKDQMIAPIILINYIENAFKYGINPELNSKIDIAMDIDDALLTLTVKNDIVVNREHLKKQGTKEGMKNNLKRLDILYPNKYTLDIVDTQTTYSCTLKINLS